MHNSARLFAGLILLILAMPATAAQPQGMTISTQFVTHVRPSTPSAGTPDAFASVLLLAGGNGVLSLDANGDVQELQANFLIRSAYRFLSKGLNVAMLDAAPTFPDPNGFNNLRHTQQHAYVIGKVLEQVHLMWPSVPVWLVGTSNGSISAANLAARLGSSNPTLKGLVLTSSVTQPGNMPGEAVTSLSPGIGSIKVPTLVVWHSGDSCAGSPSASAHTVFTGLTGLAPGMKSEVVVKGGGWVAMPGCSALGYHGYNGAEDDVIATIVKFIATHP
jgi:hypothetical protein